MDFLKQFVTNIIDIPTASIVKLNAIQSPILLKKGNFILKENEIPKNFYVVKYGLVRAYHQTESGKEYTRYLFKPLTFTGAIDALILNKPSKLSYSCLSDCELYSFDFETFKSLMNKDPFILKLYSKMMEISFLILNNNVQDLTVLNATERYLKLKKRIPDIEICLPQYLIASYLNITSVQLSRIRKQLYSK